MSNENIELLEAEVLKEVKLISDFLRLNEELKKAKNEKDKQSISASIDSMKKILRSKKESIESTLNKLSLSKPLETPEVKSFSPPLKKDPFGMMEEYPLSGQETPSLPIKKKDLPNLERISLKRLGKVGKVKKSTEKEKRPSRYVNLAVRTFYTFSRKIIYGGMFGHLKRSLVKANMQFIPENYLSVMFFTTAISFFVSLLLYALLLFFNISISYPFFSVAEETVLTRALRFFWVIFAIPIGTYFMMYVYPSLEKKSIEGKINQELPFVTIHMSSIAGAMKDPSKIFGIIISTGEYPYIQKEFAKIINEINLYGYDLVSALRNSAFNCPSAKLAELYNGISTTINSGGNLAQFFEKRAETLLFDYKIEREKYNKSTETFMDIYLSVVIAAPMILMLLLIIMRVSGLGISLSTPMISLITILGVTIANIFFLTFLYLKQPAQ